MRGGLGGILIFGFGLAAGVLVAFAGAGFLEDSAWAVISVFVGLLMLLAAVAAGIFAARKPLWKRLFGYAEAQMEMVAEPLSRVAQRAIDRDPTGATQAARDVVAVVLARYSWITTRRWLLASLTALIAAMAALAGTALLFKQNQLLEAQSALLDEQNQKIGEQTVLLVQSVELAEAARNATLAVEITEIAEKLGEAAVRAEADGPAGESLSDGSNYVNALDVQTEVDRGLILRVTSVSRALKPYRFLDSGMRPGDPSDKFRVAMEARRADLPETYARIAEFNGWDDLPQGTRLIDRPASPERGQLLNVLVTGGLRDLEALNAAGLDLSHAYVPGLTLGVFSAQIGQLSFADFTGTQLVDFDMGGAFVENARFVRARLDRANFGTLTGDRMKWPMRPEDAPFYTVLSGSDFTEAQVRDSDFNGAWMLATRFDGAVLRGVNFAQAELGTSTFRGTLILSADFTGAGLKSVDFEGAVVFGADALARLAAAAQPGSFVPESWELQPVTVDELMGVAVFSNAVSAEEMAEAMLAGEPFRMHRVGEPLR
jgi:uncharacterized protein YjbI with pentapeptide repeats